MRKAEDGAATALKAAPFALDRPPVTDSTIPPQDFATRQSGGLEGCQIEPRARRAARDLGIDVTTIVGTGPRGRVTEEDVLNRAVAKTPPRRG